jgi:hypothetical protein
MLGQDKGKLTYARLYLTAHPVGLDEALILVGEIADQYGISSTEAYREYREKLRTKRPPATAGSVWCGNIPVTQEVLISLELLASVKEDGWFVQVLFGKN